MSDTTDDQGIADAPGFDGLGGTGGSLHVPDDMGEGGPLELDFDPLLDDMPVPGVPVDAEEVAAPPDPWGSDEARKFAEVKGWQTPADVTKSYRELESELGRLRAQAQQTQAPAIAPEVQALIQQNQMLLQQMQAQQQPVEDPGIVDFEEASLEPDFDPGRAMNYIAYDMVPRIAQAAVQQALQQFDQTRLQPLQQQISPVVETVSRQAAVSEAQALRDRVGDDVFIRHGQRAGELYAANPTAGLEAAFAQAKWEDDLRAAAQARLDGQAAGGLTGGATPPARAQAAPPADPGEAMKQALRQIGGRRLNDGLSS